MFGGSEEDTKDANNTQQQNTTQGFVCDPACLPVLYSEIKTQ